MALFDAPDIRLAITCIKYQEGYILLAKYQGLTLDCWCRLMFQSIKQMSYSDQITDDLKGDLMGCGVGRGWGEGSLDHDSSPPLGYTWRVLHPHGTPLERPSPIWTSLETCQQNITMRYRKLDMTRCMQ